jgi:serine/threonine protein phosphatase PrpC
MLRKYPGGVFRRLAGKAPAPGLDVDSAELSDCGRVRDHNEDALGHVAPRTAAEARSHGWLFALADGVGGQEHGEVASRAAIDCVVAGFRRAPAGESHPALLPRLVQAANAHVFEVGHAGAQKGAGMATTLVLCALRFDRAVVAHVGDSRCYLVRHGNAQALTRDHTVAEDQLRAGALRNRSAAYASMGHILSRSLGSDLFVSPDVSEHLLLAGDVLVLCSDGLHGAVPLPEMAKIISGSAQLSAAAEELVAIANERDGSDNVSIHLIRVRSVERVGMYRGRPYRIR